MPDDVAGISIEELQLAARNHGMPLEALRYPVTPIGLHYLLTHYDIPLIDAARRGGSASADSSTMRSSSASTISEACQRRREL